MLSGKEIKQLIRSRGITQDDFARKIGMNKNSLRTMLIHGNIKMPEYEKILKGLGMKTLVINENERLYTREEIIKSFENFIKTIK